MSAVSKPEDDIEDIIDGNKPEMNIDDEISGNESEQEENMNFRDTLIEFGRALLMYALIPVMLVIFVTQYIAFLAYVPSGSMNPTLRPKSVVLVSRMAYHRGNEPQRGDIITFRQIDHDYGLVKRVIATEGETVTIENGRVYINGELLEEEYVHGQPTDSFETNTFTVPEDCLFVMGDNRCSSIDARKWEHPYVFVDDVSGKVIYCG